MEDAGSPNWMGKSVLDIYGRRLGRVIGITFDLGGKLVSVGVEQGGVLSKVDPDRVKSDREDVVVFPEWKLEARYVGLDGGGLTKRLSALTKMVDEKRISQELSKDILNRLSSIQKSQDSVIASTMAKLDDLKRAQKENDGFVSMVTLQYLAGEMTDEDYEFTLSQCEEIKATNEREILDIRRALGMAAAGDEVVTIHRDRLVRLSGNGGQSDVESPPPTHLERGAGLLATPYPNATSASAQIQAPEKPAEVFREAEPKVNPLFASQKPGLSELQDAPVQQAPPAVAAPMTDEKVANAHTEGIRGESGSMTPPWLEAPTKASFQDRSTPSEESEDNHSGSAMAAPGEPIFSRQVSEWVYAKIIDLEALDINPGDYKPLRSLER